MSEEKEAVDMVKAIHEDKCATINGRDYVITSLNHIKRRKVFAYFTHIQKDLARSDLWFMQTKEWEDVENTINSVVTFDGSLISKLKDHWDEYPEDYIMYIESMLPAISYPFLKGLSGA